MDEGLTEHMIFSEGLERVRYEVHCPWRTSPDGSVQSTATTHSSISSGCMSGAEAIEYDRALIAGI